MATKYAVASGRWSETATWSGIDGGVGGAPIPADGDDIVICAGSSVWMDVDMSSWTGVNSVGIRGGVASRGMLYAKNGASGYLKLRQGAQISGLTPNTLMGRLLVNADGNWDTTTPLDSAYTFEIDVADGGATGAGIMAMFLDIRLRATPIQTQLARTYGSRIDFTTDVNTVDVATGVFDLGITITQNSLVALVSNGGTLPGGYRDDLLYMVDRLVVGGSVSPTKFRLKHWGSGLYLIPTSQGSGNLSLIFGYSSTTGLTTFNVLDDLTGDPTWSTVTRHNHAALVTNPGNSARVNITGITASTISVQSTLVGSGTSSMVPLAPIVFTSQNVAIICRHVNAIGTYPYQGLIHQAYRGYGLFANYGDPHIINCEIYYSAATGTSGAYVFNKSAGFTFGGTANGFTAVVHECGAITFTGLLTGCVNGFTENVELSDYDKMPRSVIGGFGYGLDRFISGLGNSEFSGEAHFCNTAAYGGDIFTGLIRNCFSGAYGGGLNSGTMENCANFGCRDFGIVRGATFLGCLSGVTFGGTPYDSTSVPGGSVDDCDFYYCNGVVNYGFRSRINARVYNCGGIIGANSKECTVSGVVQDSPYGITLGRSNRLINLDLSSSGIPSINYSYPMDAWGLLLPGGADLPAPQATSGSIDGVLTREGLARSFNHNGITGNTCGCSRGGNMVSDEVVVYPGKMRSHKFTWNATVLSEPYEMGTYFIWDLTIFAGYALTLNMQIQHMATGLIESRRMHCDLIDVENDPRLDATIAYTNRFIAADVLGWQTAIFTVPAVSDRNRTFEFVVWANGRETSQPMYMSWDIDVPIPPVPVGATFGIVGIRT